MGAEDHTVAKWVREMLDAGSIRFYKFENDQRSQYSPVSLDFQVIPDDYRTPSRHK
jgi:hypothetical protein